LYAADAATANRAFQAAFARIGQLDKTMSDYDSESEVMRLSRSSPTSGPTPVSADLCRVLHAAQQLSQRTEGAFDVTVGPLTKLWRRARRRKQLPDAELLAAARLSVGYRFMLVDPQRRTVELRRPNMRIDLGAIAKGYAADEALEAMEAVGVRQALVNGGGDIAARDAPPEKAGWTIGIAPLEADGPPSQVVELTNGAVATSGDAWQFVEIDGKRYSHVLDPRSGLGLSLRSSVSVIADSGMAADSLASAVSVLGVEKGLALIDQTPGAAALIVRLENGAIKRYASRRLPKLLQAR
jgi:thiamine biosynthesis lipoprotein